MGDILRDYSALKRGIPLESENSTCATFRSHLSNSWALV